METRSKMDVRVFPRMMFALFLVCVALCRAVRARPDGAPLSACDHMTPPHGTNITGNEAGIVLGTGSSTTPGNPAEISVEGAKFKGLLVLVRHPDTDEPYGTFDDPGSSSGLKLLSCFNTSGSAVTHANTDDKQDVTLVWRPPGDVGRNGDTVRLRVYFTVAIEKERWTQADVWFSYTQLGDPRPTMMDEQATTEITTSKDDGPSNGGNRLGLKLKLFHSSLFLSLVIILEVLAI